MPSKQSAPMLPIAPMLPSRKRQISAHAAAAAWSSSRGSNAVQLRTTERVPRRQRSGSTPHDPITADQRSLPDLLLLARRPPLPGLASIFAIREQLHSQSPRVTNTALIWTDPLILPIPQKYLSTCAALTSSAPPTCPNPHSLFAAPLPCGTAFPLPPDAISCLGAFQPPAVGARRETVIAGG